jgi:hypothetical protein
MIHNQWHDNEVAVVVVVVEDLIKTLDLNDKAVLVVIVTI